MTSFGIFNSDLDLTIKFRVLPVDQCENFVSKYEDLPKNEYLFNVVKLVISNINSEVRPALSGLDPMQANETLISLYNGCIMLNPVLDIVSWNKMMYLYNIFDIDIFDDPMLEEDFFSQSPESKTKKQEITKVKAATKPFSVPKAKLNALPRYMKDRIIGQNEVIESLFSALRRHQVGLGDHNRPIGVFLFCGPSGVGKTHVAKELHGYLFDEATVLIRIDCGEFQHKHENQKLIGAPAGYAGYEDGGYLAKALKKSPSSVILLDEVEKAHPDFWDTFLKAFDDGSITDAKGNHLDFRNSIFILTSNLGNEKVTATAYKRGTGFLDSNVDGYNSKSPPPRAMVERMTLEAVRTFFKPELINRIDETIIFNHLSGEDFRKIADLEFQEVALKLKTKNYNLKWSPAASDLLVKKSSKAMEGARGMSRVRRATIEDQLAEILIKSHHPKGTIFTIDVDNDCFVIR